MIIEHTDTRGNNYLYNENFWTGRKELIVNGVSAAPLSKKLFRVEEGGEKRNVLISGNFITGVKLIMDGNTVVICQNKWYEWILIFMPFLYFALGMFCGAIGGGLSAAAAFLCAVINAVVLRSKINIILKVLICLVAFAVLFAIWFLIYAMIVGGIANAFPSLFQ